MRIFKDMELVEYLGSGVPRILQTYSKDCFKFTENFLRMTFKSYEPVYLDQEKITIGGAIDMTNRQKEIYHLKRRQ